MEQEIKIAPYPVKVIRQVTEYVLNNVGKVSALKAIDPEKAKYAKEPETIYQGFALLGVRTPDGRIMQLPVEFDLDVNSLDEAYDKFQAAAKAQLDKHMEEARKVAEAQNQPKIEKFSADALKVIQP